MLIIVKLILLMSSPMDGARNILYNFIPEVEGFESEIYDDGKGNPTIGHGFNTRSPDSDEHLQSVNLDPAKVKSGEQSVTPEIANQLLDKKLHEQETMFEKYRSEYFPSTELNSGQTAALLSMMYNSPKLLGPNIREHLNQGNHNEVLKEIMLRSNNEKSPGILKRRLREAELYGGPIDFNSSVSSLTGPELKEMKSVLKKMKNEPEFKKTIERYPFLAPDYQQPFEPVKFNKLKFK